MDLCMCHYCLWLHAHETDFNLHVEHIVARVHWLRSMTYGRAPSLFNGALFEGGSGLFLFVVFASASYVEVQPLGNSRFQFGGLYPGMEDAGLTFG